MGINTFHTSLWGGIWRLWALVLLGSLTHGLRLEAQVLRFDRITVEDGLSQSVVKAICQDHLGLVWIGTQGGLNRYDGYTMTQFLNEAGNPESPANNYVRHILQDSKNRLWIGGTSGLDRYDHQTGVFFHHQHDPERDDTLSHNSLRWITESSDGFLWVATDRGLNRFDPETGRVQRFLADPKDPKALAHQRVTCVVEDQAGRLWVATGGGLHLKTNDGFVRYLNDPQDPNSISSNGVGVLQPSGDGRLWVGTINGLNRLDPETGVFERFMHDPTQLQSLGAQRVFSLLEDDQGRLWVGLYGGGVDLLEPKANGFVHHRHDPGDPGGLTNDMVETIMQDDAGAFWFGTFEGVSRYDPAMPAFELFRHDADSPRSLSHDLVLSTAIQGDDTLWVGTFSGLNRYHPETGDFTRYLNQPEQPGSVGSEIISALATDAEDRLWVGGWGTGAAVLELGASQFTLVGDGESTPRWFVSHIYPARDGSVWFCDWNSGLIRYRDSNHSFVTYKNDPEVAGSLGMNRVRKMLQDHDGRLWVGTFGRGLDLYDPISETFRHFPPKPTEADGLGHGEIYDIYSARDHSLWIATGGGLHKMLEPGRYEIWHTSDGLPSDIVVGIAEDGEGRLWLTTLKGLSRFDPGDGSFFNYDADDGLQSNEFGPGAFSVSASGRMFAGGAKGLNGFDPERMTRDMVRPPVLITDFRLLNRSVPLQRQDPASPLTRPIELTDHLVLEYHHKMFSFDFAALHFTRPAKNRYAYKMEGFEPGWIETDASARRAVYTALPAGEYRFRVKGSNKDGVWNEEGAWVAVTILPPPWLTWWAKSLYVLGVVGLLGWYVGNQRRQLANERRIARQQRQLAEQEHLRVEDLRRIDKLKDEFLANTSHELRTPLNGIIGLAESLVDGARGPLNREAVDDLNMIVSSGRRLAGLVNDILDFSKLRNRKLELCVKPLDLHVLSGVVLALTRPLLRGKDVVLLDEIPRDLTAVSGDENRLQQVLLNLVGNAVKFTESGQVVLSAQRIEGDMVRVAVADTGIGIPAESHEAVFRSFEQVDGSDQRGFGGTGLGLAVSKQLVELHGGRIWVESKPGEGSTFYFTVPVTDQPAARERPEDPVSRLDQRIDAEEVTAISNPEPEVAEAVVSGKKPGVSEVDAGRFRILIVDDEPVNRRVLINHLSLRSYQVTEAPSGPSALKQLEEERFDLVLLDVMMPGLSGYQVCESLRKRHSFQELPVIFLTAKNQVADLVAAFDAGGNDFLSKPVSKEELLSRVRTHLQLLDTNRTLEVKVAERTLELGEKNRELETIDSIVRAMNSELQYEKVLYELPEHGRRLFSTAINGSILLWDSKDSAYRFSATTGVDIHKVKDMRFSRSELEKRYIHHGHRVTDGIYLVSRMDNLSAGDRLAGLSEAPAMLVMVMGLEETPDGFLVWDLQQRLDTVSEGVVRKLSRFRQHAASAVARALFTRTLHEKNEEILSAQTRLIMQEKMAALGTLTSGIAHELQNPLNFVNNFSSVSREMVAEVREWVSSFAEAGEARAAECLEILDELTKNTSLIHGHGMRASKIIQKMMELAKVSRGGWAETDVTSLFHEFTELALQHQRKEFPDLSVAVSRDYEQGVGKLVVDPQRLSRAIINLMNNALEAVRDQAARDPEFEGLIRLRVQHVGDGVAFSIEDNGSGVKEGIRDQIMTPFFSTKSADSGHVGLGLSVAFDVVVDEHGGQLDLESEEGRMTRVTFKLPFEHTT